MKDNKIRSTDNMYIVVGNLNIKKTLPGSQVLGVSDIIVHPDYNRKFEADLAVIVLYEEIKFNQLIQPICLWSENNDLDYIKNELGIVAGWGKDENEQESTAEPKQVSIRVTDQRTCLSSHRSFREFVTDRSFCAGRY